MKKVLTITMAFLGVIAVNAQEGYRFTENGMNGEVFRVCATIFVVLAFMVFILAILKRILEYRLKNKIVDKGIPENIVSSILQKDTGENGNMNIKWFAILAGLGIGLTIVNYPGHPLFGDNVFLYCNQFFRLFLLPEKIR